MSSDFSNSSDEEELAAKLQEPDVLLPVVHGWAGISATGEDWRSECVKQSRKDVNLCENCQIIEGMLSISLDPDTRPDSDRFVQLGSGEEVRSREYCYCCQAVSWLMEKRSLPLDRKVCIHLETAGPRDLAIYVAFPKPAKEYQGAHKSYQHIGGTQIILRPLTSKFGKETHARVYDPHHVSLDQIRKWISRCEEHHTKDCPSDQHVPLEATESNPNPLKEILLVDLERECVVTASFEARYVALSYVWGDAKSVLTTSENLEELRQPGALSQQKGKFRLPKTIKDAMLLSRSLGEKMIWVDSLCIIQDEGELKHRYLKAMASIYANAHFTIVAAEGENADYGIRGIGSDSTDRNVSCDILDFPFTPMLVQDEHEITAYPIHSKWASRGWTFQESIFSRRLLIMDRLITWICGRGSALEEFEDRPKRTWVFGQREICGLHRTVTEKANIGGWGELVGSFNMRDLTYESDILDSFAGVTTVMSQAFPGGILHGIPVMSFEIGLLWQIAAQMRRRIAVDRDGKRLSLPTWSWVGWAGYWNDEIWREAWLGIRYPASRRIVISPLVEWQKSPELLSSEDIVNEGINPDELNSTTTPHNQAKKTISTIQQGSDEPSGIVSNPASFAEAFGEDALKYGPHLHFQTKRAHLIIGKVLPASLETRAGSDVAEFVDKEGRTIGAMLPNMPQDFTVSSGEVCEIIAISCGMILEDLEEKYPVYFLQCADWALRAWYRNIGLEPKDKQWFEFYNILWVEWKDGVAYRKAMGRVIKPAWDQLDLEVVNVVLG